MNSVRHSTQEHSENGLLHHLLYAPSLLNLMSKNIFKNIFVLVHTFVLDLGCLSSLRPFGGGSNLVVRPPFDFMAAYGWTGVACMCTVQTTTAVQQAARHRAAPRRPPAASMWLVAGGGECRAVLLSDPLILLQPSSNRLLSEASFVPV